MSASERMAVWEEVGDADQVRTDEDGRVCHGLLEGGSGAVGIWKEWVVVLLAVSSSLSVVRSGVHSVVSCISSKPRCRSWSIAG